MKQKSIGALLTVMVLLLVLGIAAPQMTDVCLIDFASSWNNATPVLWSCSDFVDADACYEGCADWDCTSGVNYNSGDGLFGYGCYEDAYVTVRTCKTPEGQCVLMKKWEREITPYECNGQQDQLSRTILLVNRGCEELVSYIAPDDYYDALLSDCESKCSTVTTPEDDQSVAGMAASTTLAFVSAMLVFLVL